MSLWVLWVSSQAQTCEALAWMRMCELVARERAFPVCPLKPAVSVASWEDLDIDDDLSNLIRHVDAAAASGVAVAIPAALVVALPIECLARVFSFMGTWTSRSMHSLNLRLSMPKTEKETEKKVLRCCKYLLSQGSCLHGRVEGKQRASRQSSTLHLACWYCSCTFPHAGVQELSERNPSESFIVVLLHVMLALVFTCAICVYVYSIV